MLRAVSFVGNYAENVFLHLMYLTGITEHEWYVDDVEFNYVYFREGRYSGDELKNALEDLSRLSFARIRRYPLKTDIDTIDEYKDYVESECDSLLLFYDGGYFEFYSKDVDTLHTIFKFGVENGFERIEYVDDANDVRTWMHF